MDSSDFNEYSSDEDRHLAAWESLQRQVEIMRRNRAEASMFRDDVDRAASDTMCLESSGSEYEVNEVDLNSSDSEYQDNREHTTPNRLQSDGSDSDEPLAHKQKKMAAAKKRLFPEQAIPSTSYDTTLSTDQACLPPAESGNEPQTTSLQLPEVDENLAGSNQIGEKVDETKETGRSRRKSRQEHTWKRNVLKRLRTKGQAYTTSSGRIMRAREMKGGCGEKCRFKCHNNFSEEIRKALFTKFWSQDDKKDQSQFIARCVTKQDVKRVRVGSDRRKLTYVYSLYNKEAKQQVCKKFFLDTLDLKHDRVYGAVSRVNSVGVLSPCKQGRHGKQPKVAAEVVETIKEHIKSFPTMESHYTRKSTGKQYLSPDLSVSQMYRLYTDEMAQKQKLAAQEAIYRKIFNSCFNLDFHRPKKDQCDQCTAFRNKQNPSEDEIKAFDIHQSNKTAARNIKEKAKQDSVSNTKLAAGCFDFQQILTCPHGQVSNFYYKRKLGVFNFTVYDLGTKDAYCYMWPESDAKRGPNEVSTCLRDYISRKARAGAEIINLFSDNCGGQNRNRFVAFMIWHSMREYKVDITHTFLERGHTQNENDSVHSVIERSTRRALIYTPEQWYSSVRSARKSQQPYIVTEMSYAEFFDFKTMTKSVGNLTNHDDRSKVRWTQVRQIISKRDDPAAIFLVYEFGKDEKRVELFKRGQNRDMRTIQFQYLTERCGIKDAKKKDLLTLCQSQLIPGTYSPFFESLPLNCGVHESEDEDSDG